MALNMLPTVTSEEEVLCEALSELLAVTPKNEYGFPLGIYRPDLLPLHDYVPEKKAVEALFNLPKHEPLFVEALRETSVENLNTEDFIDADEEVNETEEEEEAIKGEEPNAGALGRSNEEDSEDPSVSRGDQVGNGTNALSTLPTASVHTSGRVAGFRREHLNAAFIRLTFDEGFPALPDGRPCWDRLQHESLTEFTAFQAYLQMPMVSNGVRTLGSLPQIMEANELLHINGHGYEAFTNRFRVVSRIYYWTVRARAYDLYQIAASRKLMETRATTALDHHFRTSENLLGKLLEYFGSDEDFWDMLTPKVAIDMLKVVTSIQRVSVGLPALAPPNAAASQQSGQPLEMILRTLSLAQGTDTQQTDGIGADKELASRILGDPRATQIAQELIIRLGNNQSRGNIQ